MEAKIGNQNEPLVVQPKLAQSKANAYIGSKPQKTKTLKRNVKEEERRMILFLQKLALVIFLCAYALLLLPTTVLVILLQGFHAGGFDLPLEVIYWLGGLTVGKLAVFTYVAIRFLFPRRKCNDTD